MPILAPEFNQSTCTYFTIVPHVRRKVPTQELELKSSSKRSSKNYNSSRFPMCGCNKTGGSQNYEMVPAVPKMPIDRGWAWLVTGLGAAASHLHQGNDI